jgi:hypothetical protein
MLKHCKGCDRDKDTRHFHRDRSTADGHYRICKQCRRPIQAAAAKRRRAKKAAYRASYATQFPVEDRERKRRMRQAMTTEERRELWRYEYHQRDKAQIAARVRERRQQAA